MTVSVEVPQDVFDRASEIARAQSMSVPEVFASACARHVADWEKLESRTSRGGKLKFLEVLAKAPDVEPEAHDRFEKGTSPEPRT